MSKEKRRVDKNIQDWEDKIIKIFPIAIPDECYWFDEIDILNVLFTLCSNKVANMFYPDGEVLELYGIDFSSEDRCIEIITGNTIDIVSPMKLSFHHYDESFELSYFRLEINNLEQICKTKKSTYKEILISLENGKYMDILESIDGCDSENKIIDDARLVNRYLKKTSFLIFAKNSYFKGIYDKSFNLYSDEELSNIIEEKIVKDNL